MRLLTLSVLAILAVMGLSYAHSPYVANPAVEEDEPTATWSTDTTLECNPIIWGSGGKVYVNFKAEVSNPGGYWDTTPKFVLIVRYDDNTLNQLTDYSWSSPNTFVGVPEYYYEAIEGTPHERANWDGMCAVDVGGYFYGTHNNAYKSFYLPYIEMAVEMPDQCFPETK
jgi:hypothetical protein